MAKKKTKKTTLTYISNCASHCLYWINIGINRHLRILMNLWGRVENMKKMNASSLTCIFRDFPIIVLKYCKEINN